MVRIWELDQITDLTFSVSVTFSSATAAKPLYLFSGKKEKRKTKMWYASKSARVLLKKDRLVASFQNSLSVAKIFVLSTPSMPSASSRLSSGAICQPLTQRCGGSRSRACLSGCISRSLAAPTLLSHVLPEELVQTSIPKPTGMEGVEYWLSLLCKKPLLLSFSNYCLGRMKYRLFALCCLQ